MSSWTTCLVCDSKLDNILYPPTTYISVSLISIFPLLRHVEHSYFTMLNVGNIEVRGTNATQTRSTQVPVQRVKIAQPSSLAVFPLPGLLIPAVYGLFVATLGRLVVLYIRVSVCI
jgi:hypothetical protein